MRVAFVVLLAGCFAPDYPDGTIPCQGACPDGFYCADDNFCYREGNAPPPCASGYERVGGQCTDINECLSSPCDAHADCRNDPGSYTCTCRAGWTGDGETCADVDECLASPCDPHADCENAQGGYACSCRPGYAGDGATCHGDYVQVSVDGDHGCGVRRDDTLWCWGANARGQLGLGPGVRRALAPAQVPGGWRQVSVALGFTCGVQRDETLWCWGDGSCGQLGNGMDTGCRTPLIADAPVSIGGAWRQVATSPGFACAVAGDGSLWCWGLNASGRLGLGEPLISPNVPTRVGSANDWTIVATGGTHTCGLRAGRLYCFGANTSGQLGDGGVASPYAASPKQIGSSTSWASVAAGQSHTCAVLGDRTIYCWGDDGFGQLGNDDVLASLNAPAPLAGTWDAVFAGRYHTCGHRAGGGLECWGRNRSGELGDGSFTQRPQPVAVAGAVDLPLASAGVDASCGLAADGRLLCWGWNGQNALGVGRGGPRETPTAGPGGDWSAIAAGATHACGIRPDQSLWCWGANDRGQLGIGATGGTWDAPQEVMTGTRWTVVATSFRNSCAIDENAALHCWGENENGEAGVGAPGGIVTEPAHIGDGYTTVSLGDYHACGVAAGTLSCWGLNGSGQLGLGAGVGAQSAPMPVGAGWDTVSAGGYHTCGLQAGALRCWGYNGYGAVGNGDPLGASVFVPQPIGSDADWVEVTAGESHTCGIRAVPGRRQLFCWGDGYWGQLGNGTSGDAALLRAPASLGVLSWNAVTAGYLRTCAVRQDGTLLCWGYNGPGLLGLDAVGDVPVVATPTPVGSRTDWQATALGWTMSFGRAGGGLLGWGSDDVGQLGDDATYFETPAEVD